MDRKITKKDNPCPLISSASIELLNEHQNRRMRVNVKQLKNPSYCSTSFNSRTLSTVEIIKVARSRFIQESSGDIYALIHPYQLDLADDVRKDVDLILLLLVSAEKVANQQFDRARRLLSACDHTASYIGNPVQRLVHYFSEALHKRIDRETDRLSTVECKKSECFEEGIARVQPSTFAYKQKLPFYVITEYAGIQAILDSMTSAKRIHLVDFAIGCGSHVTILIQALVDRKDCPIEILKVTAVGMETQSKKSLEDIGRRLLSFAETLSLPFSFKAVTVSDAKCVSASLFELEHGEAVAVYSSLYFKNSLLQFTRLETLISLIRNLRPAVMVVTEIEANTCSSDFMDSFIETLVLHGANFDSFEACMDSCDPNRIMLEEDYFFKAIQDVVSFEYKDRRIGHMKSDGWRVLFSRFGLLEMELSRSSLYQADLVRQRFACGRSCSLDMDGKCLLVGWKGTPIFSLSAWKFDYEEEG